MNEITLYQESTGISLPNVTNISTLMSYNRCLSHKDSNKVVKAYENGLYDMAAEYIWSRTINTLKKNIMKFGEDFVAEMLDRPDTMSVEDISEYEIITLSSDLGFINKTAKIEFLQFSEIIQHYMSNDEPEEEFPTTKVGDIVRSCVKYVLGFEKVEYEMSFSAFRDRLKTEYITEGHELYNQLLPAPYFYKRTVFKTLMNLAKATPDSAEREIILNNLNTVFVEIWQSLSSEDKWVVGRAYAQCLNDGDNKLLIALKSVLLKVKGFDFVPENLRSNSYIMAAKSLLATHQGINNFYNEPSKAKYLAQMGNSIPAPAFGCCMTSVLACKLGNIYGISWDAQQYLDEILKTVSKDRWIYYLGSVLQNDRVILYKLTIDNIIDRWIDVVEKYNLYELDAEFSKDIKDILQYSNSTNKRQLKMVVNRLLLFN